MKISLIIVIGTLCLPGATSSRALETTNLIPPVLQTPADPHDAVMQRLTDGSDGKTPTLKNFNSAWIQSLASRGEPTLFTKVNSRNFAFIGMPIGGIGAGELYLGGDGKLWDWDIFNTKIQPAPIEQGGAFSNPHLPGNPKDASQNVLDQGFVLRTSSGGKVEIRTLDKSGFSDITFSGQYPIGTVVYSDPDCPVQARLEAFSPFVPGSVEDSSYPATILSCTLTNTSPNPVACELAGWLENGVAWRARNQLDAVLQNSVGQNPGFTTINCSASAPPLPTEIRPPEVIDDFEDGTYEKWSITGEGLGSGPNRIGQVSHPKPVQGAEGTYYIDSFGKAGISGKLTSQSFVIDRPYLTFSIGGTNSPDAVGMRLVVDGKIVRLAAGNNDETLRSISWGVREFLGKNAHLEIWQGDRKGCYIMVDNIVLSDVPAPGQSLAEQVDFGTMALALLGDPATTEGSARLGAGTSSSLALSAAPVSTAQVLGSKLVGALRRKVDLKPGEKITITFVVSWYFPNPTNLGLQTPTSRQYSVRFKSAQDVIEHLVADFDRLTQTTRLWRDTWYDSTLPYWFLDRTFLNTSILATSTAYLLSDGRFYAYEGRYSCFGTCSHVWGYQQALGFLFPDLEKRLREHVEFVEGFGMNAAGGIAMRGEFDKRTPVDGQSGVILRTYLTHRMSPDNSFLAANYPMVKKATDYLVNTFDKNNDGIMEGPQINTMDTAWFGKITWLSLYYQAALRATAEMADDMNDSDYSAKLRRIADKGKNYIEIRLFNGQYFNQESDPAHPHSPGTYDGCPIEQLMGQSWAYQVGLGQIIDPDKAVTALNSIWKFNFTTDVGPYRKAFPAGRWYAREGDGGLIMCTFPHGGTDALGRGNTFYSAYMNETWTGSEYQETALLMWEGLVDKALAQVRTINERYDASKRNPWDECECGSHYSRALAGYGVFTAACGFDYDGPKGSLAFAPRISPENFKASFTSAEGWGSFSQKSEGSAFRVVIDLRHGKLRLKTLSLVPPSSPHAGTVKASVNGRFVPATCLVDGKVITVQFTSDLLLNAGEQLALVLE